MLPCLNMCSLHSSATCGLLKHKQLIERKVTLMATHLLEERNAWSRCILGRLVHSIRPGVISYLECCTNSIHIHEHSVSLAGAETLAVSADVILTVRHTYTTPFFHCVWLGPVVCAYTVLQHDIHYRPTNGYIA